MPKTNLGKWSVGLIIFMFILFFIGMSLADSLYGSVPSGGTILADISARPLLAISMLTGDLLGISAFVTGLIGIVKHKERSILVYISTLIGALLIIFLIAEILFPH